MRISNLICFCVRPRFGRSALVALVKKGKCQSSPWSNFFFPSYFPHTDTCLICALIFGGNMCELDLWLMLPRKRNKLHFSPARGNPTSFINQSTLCFPDEIINQSGFFLLLPCFFYNGSLIPFLFCFHDKN